MKNAELSSKLRQSLGLSWPPVAIKLVSNRDSLPKGVPKPKIRLRHCQSVMIARRGNALLLTPEKHACPDGAALLGLTELPEKIKNGKLCLAFGKFNSIGEAKRMVDERPRLETGSIKATVVSPLDKATFAPDVVVFTMKPEQAMWLICASTYFTGERLAFTTSGFNAMCVDITLIPHLTGRLNISLGCHGARGATDLDDNEILVGIPGKMLAKIAEGLGALSEKLISDERKKVWMLNAQALNSLDVSDIIPKIKMDVEKCNGCGICVDMCVMDCFGLKEGEKKVAVVDADACVACRVCSAYCPKDAIEIEYQSLFK